MIAQRHTQIALNVVGLMVVAQVSLDLMRWGQVLILAPAAAVLGLPRGASDLPMAEAL